MGRQSIEKENLKSNQLEWKDGIHSPLGTVLFIFGSNTKHRVNTFLQLGTERADNRP